MKEQIDKQDGKLSPDSKVSQITPEDILEQLDLIFSSPDLKVPKKVETIFSYLTEEK